MPPGRPKKTDTVLELEVRITPPDQQPITQWLVEQDEAVQQLLSCEEGTTNGEPKLHYHCLIRTTHSRTWLTKWIYTVARCIETGEKGNAVFFTRKPHEHSIGYVLKHNAIVCRKGYEQQFVDEWILKSKQYRTDKETERKRDQRSRKYQQAEIMETLKKGLHDATIERSVEGIAQVILNEFRFRNLLLPTRSQIEQMILTQLYPYNQQFVQSMLIRHLTENYFSITRS